LFERNKRPLQGGLKIEDFQYIKNQDFMQILSKIPINTLSYMYFFFRK